MEDVDGLADRRGRVLGTAGSDSIRTVSWLLGAAADKGVAPVLDTDRRPAQTGLARAARGELSRRLRSREADILEAVLAQVRAVAPDAVSPRDERLETGLREMVAACVDGTLAILEGAEPGYSSERRRAEIVRRLLAGEPADTHELAELGYEVDAWHVCVVATGPSCERAVRRLQAGLGRQLLCVASGEQAVLAWLGGQRRPADTDVERLLSAREHADACVAVSEPARGLDGWRQAYREAKRAALVAGYRPRRFTRYRDVALEAAALEDEALAASLIRTYLSPLDDGRGGGAIRRRVLRALFEAEHNKSSAANALRVDRDTVHRHVKEIERRLGHRLHERRAEVEIALRLVELLGFEQSVAGRLPEPRRRELDVPMAPESR
jgi:hypothetical protein